MPQTALVFGRATGVWDEVERAMQTYGPFDHVAGVGSAVIHYPGYVNHWITYHSIPLERLWIPKRRKNGYPDAEMYWTARYRGSALGRKCVLPLKRVVCEGGSSAMIAVLALRSLNVERIILAGVPMQVDAGQYDTNKPWREAPIYRKYWQEHRVEFGLDTYVRSMSGWTREQFGRPTLEWLNGSD